MNTVTGAASRSLVAALLASALVIAACGLVYELVAGALASYLLGDTVTRFSTVIGSYLFAMGVGAWLAKHLRGDLVAAFVRIELLVGVVGGFSTLLLYAVFAGGHGFELVLYGLVLIVGILVGLEIPLLLRILRHRIEFDLLVSRVLSLDYLGALAASLLFPLWFVPKLGLTRTSLFFGLVNVAVAALTLWLLPVARRRRLALATAVAAALLLAGWWNVEPLTRDLDRRIFNGPVIYSAQTAYQRIAVTRAGAAVQLFLNGHLQFNSADEYRYHEALVHPALRGSVAPDRALVLGGGDGLAVRELLRQPSIRAITVVDLDPGMTRLFREHPQLSTLNGHALADPRVSIVNADAWQWLRQQAAQWPLIIVDLPDPSSYAIAKLYTEGFYRSLAAALTADGIAAIQATSPLFAREAFWCVVQTLEQAGLQATPYHAYVPSFGEWGFVLAGHRPYLPRAPLAPGLRFLDDQMFASLFRFPPDMARLAVEPNRLDTQRLVQYYELGWRRSLASVGG